VVVIGSATLLVDGYLPHETGLSPPFSRRGGNAWIAQLPDLARFADKLEDGTRSRLTLTEDDTNLGPAHSPHDDVGRYGNGRFSHWGATVVFSTSDNSDPNSNGRAYRVRLEAPRLDRLLWSEVPPFIGIVLGGFVAVPLLLTLTSRALAIPPQVCVILSGLGASFIALLAANIVDVSRWPGVVVHFGLALMITVVGVPTVYLLRLLRRNHAVAANILLSWYLLSGTALSLETLARAAPARDTLAINPGNKFFWPDWTTYPLNNFGYRDRDFETPKPPGVFRILLLGDSFTEGNGLRRDHTFGRLLQQHLNKEILAIPSTLQVEVFNLGHSGFNTWEEWQSLERDGSRLDPDLVILNYVINDAELHKQVVADASGAVSMQDVDRLFLGRLGSYAYYLGFVHGHMFQDYPSLAELTIAQHEDPIGWGALSLGLENIGRWCRTRHIPAIGLLWPVFAPSVQDSFAPVIKKVADEMGRGGLSAYPLEPEFTRFDRDLEPFAFSPEDWHPNARANRIVADWLEQLVKSLPNFTLAVQESKIAAGG
jgi:hypothetical protein